MFRMNEGKQPSHIFFTGEKQIGKSTLLQKLLKSGNFRYCGLQSFTEAKDGKKYVYLEEMTASPKKAPQLCGICAQNKAMEVYNDVFNNYGVSLLEPQQKKLLVINEIGFMENSADIYVSRIKELLKRTDIHILGVVRQDSNSLLYNEIRNSPNVKLFIIRKSNRDRMQPVIVRLLSEISF